MNFKKLVQADSKSVFLNNNEFADLHTIRFDGEEYANIPVVLTKVKQSDRTILQSDHVEGIYLVTAKAYFNAADTNGQVPEKGKVFDIDDGTALGRPFFRRYRVVTSEIAMGMVELELEAYDE